jgi:excisionase family DNA binding protein
VNDRPPADGETFLTVHEVAEHLRLNEKKIYALVKEGAIPATKAAGKWLFPRRLVDEWLLESVHGGILTDRLLIAGSDDPLLAAAVAELAARLQGAALVALAPTGTRLGLALLTQRRANVCGIHWGLAAAADRRHAQLVRGYPGFRDWTLVRLARREQGVLLGEAVTGARELHDLVASGVRWAMRQDGAGSQHFLSLALGERGLAVPDAAVAGRALTERHAAAEVAHGRADCAPGVRSAAAEFGLAFLPLGWECFDLVLPKAVYFRHLFQQLLDVLRSAPAGDLAAALAGYDLEPLGRVIPIPEE